MLTFCAEQIILYLNKTLRKFTPFWVMTVRRLRVAWPRAMSIPDSKIHGANMGSTWVLSAPCWPHKPCYQGWPRHAEYNQSWDRLIFITGIPMLVIRRLYPEPAIGVYQSIEWVQSVYQRGHAMARVHIKYRNINFIVFRILSYRRHAIGICFFCLIQYQLYR